MKKILGALLVLPVACIGTREPSRVLRVCADPNNLPFSNRRHEGLENRVAEILAKEMGARLEYTWWPQRRGFVRNTLRAHTCDVVPGVASGYELVLTTKPYYRSTYVFVSRQDRHVGIRSLDDPRLRTLKVGVQLIGEDGFNTPPVHALSRRGIVGNLVGYSVFGDYSQENPPARIVDAVAAGQVDVAIVWGPLAGYFAKRQPVALEIVPVSPAMDVPFLPFVFDIALGVRREDVALKQELEGILERRQADIRRVLEAYGVPLVEPASAPPQPLP